MPLCALLVVPQVLALPRAHAATPRGLPWRAAFVLPPAGQVRVAALVVLLTVDGHPGRGQLRAARPRGHPRPGQRRGGRDDRRPVGVLVRGDLRPGPVLDRAHGARDPPGRRAACSGAAARWLSTAMESVPHARDLGRLGAVRPGRRVHLPGGQPARDGGRGAPAARAVRPRRRSSRAWSATGSGPGSAGCSCPPRWGRASRSRGRWASCSSACIVAAVRGPPGHRPGLADRSAAARTSACASADGG